MNADFMLGLVVGVIVSGACLTIGIAIGMAFIGRLYGRDY